MLLFSVFSLHWICVERLQKSLRKRRCCLHPVGSSDTEFYIKMIFEILGGVFRGPCLEALRLLKGSEKKLISLLFYPQLVLLLKIHFTS